MLSSGLTNPLCTCSHNGMNHMKALRAQRGWTLFIGAAISCQSPCVAVALQPASAEHVALMFGIQSSEGWKTPAASMLILPGHLVSSEQSADGRSLAELSLSLVLPIALSPLFSFASFSSSSSAVSQTFFSQILPISYGKFLVLLSEGEMSRAACLDRLPAAVIDRDAAVLIHENLGQNK